MRTKPESGLRPGEASMMSITSSSQMVNQFSESGIKEAKELESQWPSCTPNLAFYTNESVLMTLCAGIHPNRTIPVVLDVGTNVQPFRVPADLRTKNYWTMTSTSVFLGSGPADPNMTIFLKHLLPVSSSNSPWRCSILKTLDCTMRDGCWRNISRNWHVSMVRFSEILLTADDIQGTGCVAQAAIKAAVWVAKGKVSEQKMIVFGAGTAGTGLHQAIQPLN